MAEGILDKYVDRPASRVADGITIGVAATSGTVIAIVGGLFRSIQRFSILWRSLFWVSFSLLVLWITATLYVMIRRRAAVRRLAQSSGDVQTSPQTFTAMAVSGGTNIRVQDTRMYVGSRNHPTLNPLVPPDNRPETLRKLKLDLWAVSQALYQFISERQSAAPDAYRASRPTRPALRDAGYSEDEIDEEYDRIWNAISAEADLYREQTIRDYHLLFEGRAFYLFDEARKRGYATDQEARSAFEHPMPGRGYEEVARWLAVFSERIEVIANDS